MNPAIRTTEESNASLLILLVGSNPVPNYLSACALRPSRIALVYTAETKDAKDRLKQELEREAGNTVTFVDSDSFIEDATCATTVQRVIDGLMKSARDNDVQEVWLNYTGGTKVMAAHARMSYAKRNGDGQHASYLDEGGQRTVPRLRFDDGTSQELSAYANVPLNLQSLLALHSITYKPRTPTAPAPTVDDARAILSKVLAEPSLTETLYSERKRLEKGSNPKKHMDAPFQAEKHGLTLSVSEFPTAELLEQVGSGNTKKSWFEQWYKFIGGEWLEEWVGEQIRQIGLQPTPEITIGVNAFRGGKEVQLEVDVAVIRGHRSYFISCTTDTTKPICKSKLFEVTVRARNLGGDLARAALVCLADDTTVAALQKDVNDVWGASNTTKVFGRSDITDWSNRDGKQPNRHGLKTWLES